MRLNKASAWLALSLAIVQPMSQAHAAHAGVESAVQNLQYSLTVEWDQNLKNTEVRDAAIAKFHTEIEALRKQGVSETEILETLKSQALDANTAKDIEQIALNKNLSKAEKAKAVQTAVINSQPAGAQWSGAATGLVAGTIVVGLLLLLILSADSHHVGVTYYDPYYDPYYNCGYDYYGYYYCY